MICYVPRVVLESIINNSKKMTSWEASSKGGFHVLDKRDFANFSLVGKVFQRAWRLLLHKCAWTFFFQWFKHEDSIFLGRRIPSQVRRFFNYNQNYLLSHYSIVMLNTTLLMKKKKASNKRKKHANFDLINKNNKHMVLYILRDDNGAEHN